MTDQPRFAGSDADAGRTTAQTAPLDERELARQVAERVWQLWREELRREHERRGRRARQ